MSDFDSRLKQAMQRGVQRSQDAKQQEAEKQASEDELRRLHSQHRLVISEHIEKVIHKIVDHIPGFRFETVFGEQGWGAAAWRDELRMKSGQSQRRYSRLEITVRPVTSYFILEARAKGTIANREALTRSHFESLADASPETFKQLIDSWSVQFVELYMADTT